ncbi:MAG: hypothetical protein R3D70_05925 [Rhizobiaceae bacterium]
MAKSKAQEQRSIGRPLVVLADLPDGWRTIMHSIYAEGGSDAEVKVALAIEPARAMSNDLWDSLQEREPVFSEAVKEGRVLAEAWWARLGQKGITMGKRFNGVPYIFNMHNRFKENWKNKQDVQHSNDPNNPISTTHIYLPDNGRGSKAVDTPAKSPQHRGNK